MTWKILMCSLVHFLNIYNTGAHTLAVVDFGKSHSDAITFCRRFGHTLARIEDINDLYIVRDAISKYGEQIWTGLELDVSKLPDHCYLYENGDKASFFNWYPGEPKHPAVDRCIKGYLENNELFYKTAQCSLQHFFVCQGDLLKLTTAITTLGSTTEMPSTTNSPQSRPVATTYTLTSHPPTEHLNKTKTQSGQVEFTKKLETIKTNLRIDKSSLTRYRMRLSCAEDDRASATSVGLIGAACIASIFLVIVLNDITKVVVTLWNYLK